MKHRKKILLFLLFSVLFLCSLTNKNVKAGTSTTRDTLPNIILGYYHTAYIDSNGNLYCWGYNGTGQVGVDGTSQLKKPVKILSNVKSASLGMYHSAAITTDGDLYCWGNNNYGQLGNNSTKSQDTPIKVLENVASVYLCQGHSAAITTNGDLYCWGYNYYGEVGNGSTEDQKTPVKILENVSTVTMRYRNSAAITTNGDLYCWGWNYYGQIGNGNYSASGSYQTSPVKVLSDVKDVSLGNYHTIALTTDGTAYCWGGNGYGQVGNGETTLRVCSKVKLLDNVESVYAGFYSSAALTKDRNLYCWGHNNSGTVGNGSTEDQVTPQIIKTDVKSFSLDSSHCTAITTSNDVYCWGYNYYGQVGNGSTEDQTTPVKVFENASYITSTSGNTAALDTNGELYCWGHNYYGQIGNNTNTNQTTPLKIKIYDCDFTYTISDNKVTITGYVGSDTNVIIPDTLEGYPVVAIADDAFLENKNLKSITFPDSLEEIGNFSFASCESLEKTIFPKSVTFIGDQAFANCSKLKDFSVSSENQTYTTIDGVLFSKDKTTLIICPSGKTGTKDYPGTYEIPSGVTNIASHAFTGCNALSSIIFPESVISLGDEIFTNTGSLHKIFFKGKPPAFSDSTLTGSLLSRIYYSFIFDTEWQDISKNTYGGKASTQWLKSDIWSFSNNYISSAHPDGMGTISDGYILTDSDYQRLTSNLEEVDFQRIDYALKHSTNNWGGSCYGLSTWVCMNYAGEKTSKDIENVTNIQDASDCLYEWDNRAEIKSAINFYHLQKNLLYTKGYCLEFMEFSQGIQLTKLHNLALQNTPFVITFSLYNSQGNETGHAIVGYGMESGSYQKTITIGDEKYTHTYPYRIKIYDPNWPNGGDEYYIYYDVNYDDNKNIWCIPGYNIISTSNDISADEDKHDNAQLNLVTNDMEQLNSIDYTTGKINFKYASETLKNLFELISENTCYNITIGEKTYTISGFNISTEDSDKADHSIRIFPDWNETVEDDFSDSQTTVTLPFNEDGYQISCLEDSMKFALYGQNYFLTVNANSPGTIDFSNTGNISVNLEEETYYHLSITANNGYNGTIWNTVEAQGTGSGTIELKQKDSGIEINGDQAGETTITVSDKDKTQLITVNSEQDCIFITDDNGKLTAYEDSDNNGDYDTKLPNLNTVPISNCEIAINPVSYIYTGKPITPSIKVTYKDSVLAEGENYAITYEKNINVGTASVIITGIGDYNGTITKNYFITKANNVISASNKTKTVSTKTQSLSLGASAKEKTKLSYTSNSKSITVNPSGKVTIKKNYVGQATITITAAETANYKKAVKKITVTVNPKGTKISKISNSAAKKVTVKWKKNSAVNGYQIQYSTNSAFSSFKTITVKKYQTVSTIISKLQKEKTYYVRIRTYKKASGKSYYSTWSSKKKIKVKK